LAGIAADLRDRITALGRAHDFVRPHSPASMPAHTPNSLSGLLGELFNPYQVEGQDRMTVAGDDIAIDDRSATPLALLFHELATNATKYGALLRDDGRITLDISATEPIVTLRWSETGGPPVTAPGAIAGFGSQLVEMSAVRQLGGTVAREWLPGGLVMTIEVPRTAFSRR
jgi:two-component sensor histidine kinase